MSETVAQELSETKPLLLQKIESNEQLANVLMGLLGRLILECTAKGYKFNAVRLGSIQENNGRFMSRIVYLQTTLMLPPKRIEGKNDFVTYLNNKNSSMATMLRVNSDVARSFEELTMRIEQYAFHKRIPFNELVVVTNGAFISRDDELVITVGKEDIGVTRTRGFKKHFGFE